MARRVNELFIGADKLSLEGRSIKHPALIRVYATPNVNKISDEMINLIGLDIETNHLTGELKLLGIYDGYNYHHYYNEVNNWISILFKWIRYCDKQDKNIAYWSKLDPFIIFKQFHEYMNDKDIHRSMLHFSKVSGEWDKGKGWTIKPLTEVKIGDYYFGIKNVIRSSMQFYFYKKGWDNLRTVWSYDIKELYESGLEKEASLRLDYYSKIDQSVHLVDWTKYETDSNYKALVLRSNELDSRAVYDLGLIIQKEFKTAFNYYPRVLISQGSMARASIVAVLTDKYKDKDKVSKEINSIGFISHYDNWIEQYGGDTVKDLYALSMEAYSGGQIETYRYGYSKEGYTADITSAYPSVIVGLYDLRGSKITKGSGEPPHIQYSYSFIRGEVNIPDGVDYHPLTIKHPLHLETNIRAIGEYRASYTLEERDFLVSLGATFTNEVWYNIETKGELSPLAEVTRDFVDLRAKLRAEGNTAQFMAKISMNSIYGILYEAVDTYVEVGDKTAKDGYRAGEFFNPIYATIITSRTRLTISKACHSIVKNGGKPILVMTDSIFWQGSEDMLPSDLWRETKTLGYFEKPDKVNDIVCLGSGRYGYTNDKGYTQSKRRGLNIIHIHDPAGIPTEEFNWLQALKIAYKNNTTDLNIMVRSLISVGQVLGNHSYTNKDLGRVVETKRQVDLIVGATKRSYSNDIKNAKKLMRGLIDTKPLYLSRGMTGEDILQDQTLPELRQLMMVKEVITRKEREQEVSRKTSKRYYNKNRDQVNDKRSNVYSQLRELGYTSKEALSMRAWSMDKIKNKLIGDNKI